MARKRKGLAAAEAVRIDPIELFDTGYALELRLRSLLEREPMAGIGSEEEIGRLRNVVNRIRRATGRPDFSDTIVPMEATA